MDKMFRSATLAAFLLACSQAVLGQNLSILHIKVILVDSERGATPVPRHRLLISDNPATAAPRLVVTGADGTVDVRLRPGNYTVESDRPVVLRGKSYQWTQILDIVANRETTLELTAANAEIETAVTPPAADSAAGDAPLENEPSLLLPKWQDSVVALWTPTAHASGFLIDSRGLIVTNERAVGSATSVEVQLTGTIKIPANVLASDRTHDAAVVWVDAAAVSSLHPVPLICAGDAKRMSDGQKIYTISSPLSAPKDLAVGTVKRVDPHRVVSDLEFGSGGAGGPVFAANGDVVGITSVVQDRDQSRSDDSPVVPVIDVCDVVKAAEPKMGSLAPPASVHLPVEPDWPPPIDALKEAVSRRAGSLTPYQLASASFDISFITPLLTYGAQYQSQQAQRAARPGSRAPSGAVVSSLLDFANWSEYVDAFPPVLLIRVTPKQVENFWTTVARGAAQTQGVSIPRLTHFNGSFSRLRAFCGDAEVTPIHPFKLERQLSETASVTEGLYAFDPNALGPQCGTVKLSLFSEKEPDKEDARTIDPRVVDQIWQDFAPYRTTASR